MAEWNWVLSLYLWVIIAVEKPAEETMAEWNEIITAAENPAEEIMAEWNEIIIAVEKPAKEPASGWVELGFIIIPLGYYCSGKPS